MRRGLPRHDLPGEPIERSASLGGTLVNPKRLGHLAAAAGIAAIAAACGAAALASPAPAAIATTVPAPSAAVSNDLVKDVDVDGHKLHVICVGPIDSGRPTVLLEAGLGGAVDTWGAVLSELQKTDRACAYDRLGDGQSDPAPGPRTTSDQVGDLRGLLQALDVAPPYVLVGYSVGGWNVMVHHDLHGDDIVGAVMADVRPPGVSARWLEALPAETAGESEGIRLNREDLTVFEADPSLNPEQLDLRASAAEAIESGGFGDKPLVVLAAANTAAITEGLEGPLAAAFEGAWWELQQAMADLSTAGRLEKVENSTHDMPWERTDAIVAAIREVLGG
jgi:pimeloyl-ACP methyl ester carboxylesterase